MCDNDNENDSGIQLVSSATWRGVFSLSKGVAKAVLAVVVLVVVVYFFFDSKCLRALNKIGLKFYSCIVCVCVCAYLTTAQCLFVLLNLITSYRNDDSCENGKIKAWLVIPCLTRQNIR